MPRDRKKQPDLLPGELRADELAALAHRRHAATPAYHQALLDLAERLLHEFDQKPTLAIIVAQTALELATALAIDSAITKKGAEYLLPWIRARLRNTNLANEVVRDLYEALTGDKIPKGIWDQVRHHNTLRNQVIHAGAIADRDDARDSIDAVSAAIAYLESVRTRADQHGGKP